MGDETRQVGSRGAIMSSRRTPEHKAFNRRLRKARDGSFVARRAVADEAWDEESLCDAMFWVTAARDAEVSEQLAWVRQYAESPHANVRLTFTYATERLMERAPESTALLDAVEPLLDDADERVRRAAFDAVGLSEHPRMSALLRQLVAHSDPWVRRAAVRQLVKRGDPEALDLARQAGQGASLAHRVALRWAARGARRASRSTTVVRN